MILDNPTHYSEFVATNESLYAIMKGLNVEKKDDVLTICGSGDQAFAFLGVAKKVRVIDLDQRSIDRIVNRVEMLRRKDYSQFFDEDNMNNFVQNRNRYFIEKERINHIKKNLDNLNILGLGDIIDYASKGEKFNKLYLSNAVGYYLHWENDKISSALDVISTALPKEGLVYISRMQKTYWMPPIWEDLIPEKLIVDESLTNTAIKLESSPMWKPLVLRKI